MSGTSKDDHTIAGAKKKLSEIRGRPFDVDTILALNRAKEERLRELGKKAVSKLEETVKAARDRRHKARERSLESENEAIQEAKLKVDAEERRKQQKDARAATRKSLLRG